MDIDTDTDPPKTCFSDSTLLWMWMDGCIFHACFLFLYFLLHALVTVYSQIDRYLCFHALLEGNLSVITVLVHASLGKYGA